MNKNTARWYAALVSLFFVVCMGIMIAGSIKNEAAQKNVKAKAEAGSEDKSSNESGKQDSKQNKEKTDQNTDQNKDQSTEKADEKAAVSANTADARQETKPEPKEQEEDFAAIRRTNQRIVVAVLQFRMQRMALSCSSENERSAMVGRNCSSTSWIVMLLTFYYLRIFYVCPF